ncbi:MAG: hypothetical protein KIC97_00535 [Firmicutes bacterium]|nr:hypothetical protein [Bacillota bacterium]
MEFFEEAFHWLAGVSEKLPVVDIKMFFIVVLSVISGIGVITAFTLLGSHARKLYVSSKKIRKYLANVDAVDDDNVSDFTAHCFSKKTPQQLRDTWVQYLGVRFGYPSDIVSDSAVYDKFVKKNKDVRSGVFLAISLILLGLFAFWGYGTLQDAKMGVVHLAALVLIGVIYLVLVILARKQNQRCLETFEAMQEDLDAKVNLQIESNYATDSSPLQELNALVEEIIARNTAKAVDIDENEQTPIEALIEQKMKEQSGTEEDEQESIDEIINAQEEEAEEIAQEESDQTKTEIEEGDQEVAEQQHIDELLQEQEEEVEQKAEEEDEQIEQVIDEQLEQEVVEPQEAVEEQEEIVPENEEEQIDEQEEIEEQEPVEEEPVQEDEQVEEQAQEETVDEQSEEAEEPQIEEADEDNSDVEEENTASEETEASEDVDDIEEDEQTEEAVEESTTDSAEEENVEDSAEEDVASEEEQSEDESEEEQSETESEEIQEAQEDEEPEVVYVVEGDDEDDDEHVKPAKLVKLPNLVDYMLSKNMPKAMKIQIATMLIGTYNKFKDSKEDRKIVVSCLSKVMRDLQSNN